MARRFAFDKLIRDKLPVAMRHQGCLFQAQVLECDEYVHMLKKKLLEEAEEVYGAQGPDEIIEELADVLEVLHATANALGMAFERVEERRLTKREVRGGFDERTYIPYVEVEETNPFITRFSSQPEKYPEVESTKNS
jgi:predicted house-cleaning noncanonical NTP pyrophosphatase (MazG superfamily)